MTGTIDQPSAGPLFDLTGRVALVTGGGTGLGRAAAEALLANGARVVIAGRDGAVLRDAAIDLGRAGDGRIAASVADVRAEDDVRRMFEAAEAAFGTVDILVNAAGVAIRKPALDLARADWAEIHAVNVEGTFAVSREAAARMIAAERSGSIVTIGSFLQQRPMRNVAAYAASKAALRQMTRALALEWARHGIRVNEIAPGWFATAMTEPFLGGRAAGVIAAANPQRRLGRPGDIAGAVLLLASDAGSYITGASIAVDGGQSLA